MKRLIFASLTLLAVDLALAQTRVVPQAIMWQQQPANIAYAPGMVGVVSIALGNHNFIPTSVGGYPRQVPRLASPRAQACGGDPTPGPERSLTVAALLARTLPADRVSAGSIAP